MDVSEPSRTWDEPPHAVVPIAGIDADGGLGTIFPTYCLRLDGPMDPNKLKGAMEDLATKRWKILGARIASNPKTGKWEYHVPFKFDNVNVPFEYSTASFTDSVENHFPSKVVDPLEITVHPEPDSIRTFNVCRFTNTADLLVTPNRPIMAMRIICFSDATLVGLELPHTFNDAKGFGHIIRAWADCLNHGPNSVPELPLGIHHLNTLFRLDDNSIPEVKPWGMSLLTRLNQLRLAAAAAREAYAEPKEAVHMIHIPGPEIERIRREAQRWVDSQGGEACKLSTNDVLVAWATKACFGSRPPKTKSQVYTRAVMELRSRLPQIFDEGPLRQFPFLHNGTFPLIYRPLRTVEEIQNAAVGELARDLRRAVSAVTPERLSANYKWTMNRISKIPIMFTPPAQQFMTTSGLSLNICSSDVNFSAALTQPGDNPRTRIVDVGYTGQVKEFILGFWRDPQKAEAEVHMRRNCGFFEDGEHGGVWLQLCVAEGDWEKGILGSLKRAQQPLNRAKL